jgi:transposase
VRELVPADDPAHLVRDLIRQELDLSEILGTYGEERGFPPYHPTMMTALLLYAYAQGVYSSRRIARACERRVDFMAVTAMQKPDFRTISDFRKRHLRALGGLFQQVLRLCARAGLVKLGHVALDGTKVGAKPDQGGPGLSPLPPPWPVQGPARVGPHLHGPQPHKDDKARRLTAAVAAPRSARPTEILSPRQRPRRPQQLGRSLVPS